MKRILTLLLFFALLCPILSSSALASPPAEDIITIEVYDQDLACYQTTQAYTVNTVFNGTPLDLSQDVPALALGGRTMVPVRTLGEPLGATVTWIQDSNQVVLSRGEDVVVLTLGSPTALVNGQPLPLPDGIPAVLVRYQGIDRTMVPIRFVSEQLGATVEWEQETRTAYITAGANVLTAINVHSDRQTVLLATRFEPQFRLTDLGDRLVVDLLDTHLMEPIEGAVPVDNDFITSVRFAPHGSELYPEYDQSVRVVFDLKEGVNVESNLSVEKTPEGILVTTFLPADGSEPPAVPQLPYDPEKKLIVIDPGHGGGSSGAVYEGIQEKDLDLSVALKLSAILQEKGFQVIMTRSDDRYVGLYERAALANQANADLFVSVHANAYNLSYIQGVLTYHFPSSDRGQRLAQIIQASLCAATGATDRGIAADDFVVLRETDMCAVLVEMGFMTNHAELMRLSDSAYQDAIAAGIADGIAQYFS